MKKLILLFACLLVYSHSLFAQDEFPSYRMLLGGTFNISFNNNGSPANINGTVNPNFFFGADENYSNNSVSISPYFGKPVSKFWDVGFQMKIGVTSFTAEYLNFIFNPSGPPAQVIYVYESNTTQYGLGLFARYNFMPDKKFNIYTQPFIQYNFSKQEDKSDGEQILEINTTFLQIGVGVGASYQFTDRLAALVNFGDLSYYGGNWENKRDNTKNDFSSFNMNFNASNFFLGIEFRL